MTDDVQIKREALATRVWGLADAKYILDDADGYARSMALAAFDAGWSASRGAGSVTRAAIASGTWPEAKGEKEVRMQSGEGI